MRLIDADALGVGLCSQDILSADYCAGWNGLISILENAPHRGRRAGGALQELQIFSGCQTDDDFCSYGERRESDEEK